MILVQMPEPLRITFAYNGPSVDDGTMSIADVLSALQGFSGVYGKIAARLSPNTQHCLRVSAVKQGSFEVHLLSLVFLGGHPGQEHFAEMALDAGKLVVGAIVKLIDLKKHTKGKPYEISVKGNENKIVVINADNAKFELPRELLEILKDRVVDIDLSRIASPLRRNEIDSARITSEGISGEMVTAEVLETDKDYFDSTPMETTTTSNSAQIEGSLISLNKERNRGTFRLQDGSTIPYEYIGSDQYAFHADFSARGSVKVTCDADFDQNLRPTKIRIKLIERIQRDLRF